MSDFIYFIVALLSMYAAFRLLANSDSISKSKYWLLAFFGYLVIITIAGVCLSKISVLSDTLFSVSVKIDSVV